MVPAMLPLLPTTSTRICMYISLTFSISFCGWLRWSCWMLRARLRCGSRCYDFSTSQEMGHDGTMDIEALREMFYRENLHLHCTALLNTSSS